MYIKHLTLMAGPAGTFEVGHVRAADAKEAAALIAGGYAIEVNPPHPETATARRGETATAAEQDAARHLKSIGASARSGKVKKTATAPQQEAAATTASADPAAVAEHLGLDVGNSATDQAAQTAGDSTQASAE